MNKLPHEKVSIQDTAFHIVVKISSPSFHFVLLQQALVRFCLLHFNDACEHQSVELSVDEHLGIHQENEAFSVGVH